MSTSQPPPGWTGSPAASVAEQERPSQPPVVRARGPSAARAGFWRRFAAAFVDGLIVGVPAGILEVALKGTGYVLALLLVFAYFSYLEGGPTGAGFGKRAMGIRVIDLDTGGPIGHGRACVRVIGRWISAIVIYVGYLWMLWDREKQCWHDKMANDVVVQID